MNKYLLFSALCFVCYSTPALSKIEEFHIITAEEALNPHTVGNDYVAQPSDVAKSQHIMNRYLQNAYETYSQPELARLALQINQAQTRAARREGRELPPALTREILNDRDKIIEYLKSEYEFKY